MANLVTEDSSKQLWKFIKSRKCDETGVALLKTANQTHTTSIEKANVLNEQFCSVFTREDQATLPNVTRYQTPEMHNITVTINGETTLEP